MDDNKVIEVELRVFVFAVDDAQADDAIAKITALSGDYPPNAAPTVRVREVSRELVNQ